MKELNKALKWIKEGIEVGAYRKELFEHMTDTQKILFYREEMKGVQKYGYKN